MERGVLPDLALGSSAIVFFTVLAGILCAWRLRWRKPPPELSPLEILATRVAGWMGQWEERFPVRDAEGRAR